MLLSTRGSTGLDSVSPGTTLVVEPDSQSQFELGLRVSNPPFPSGV